jgi:hypothetical protein
MLCVEQEFEIFNYCKSIDTDPCTDSTDDVVFCSFVPLLARKAKRGSGRSMPCVTLQDSVIIWSVWIHFTGVSLESSENKSL